MGEEEKKREVCCVPVEDLLKMQTYQQIYLNELYHCAGVGQLIHIAVGALERVASLLSSSLPPDSVLFVSDFLKKQEYLCCTLGEIPPYERQFPVYHIAYNWEEEGVTYFGISPAFTPPNLDTLAKRFGGTPLAYRVGFLTKLPVFGITTLEFVITFNNNLALAVPYSTVLLDFPFARHGFAIFPFTEKSLGERLENPHEFLAKEVFSDLIAQALLYDGYPLRNIKPMDMGVTVRLGGRDVAIWVDLNEMVFKVRHYDEEQPQSASSLLEVLRFVRNYQHFVSLLQGGDAE